MRMRSNDNYAKGTRESSNQRSSPRNSLDYPREGLGAFDSNTGKSRAGIKGKIQEFDGRAVATVQHHNGTRCLPGGLSLAGHLVPRMERRQNK